MPGRVPEIASWARILCPLFDTVIIKWKGELGGKAVVVPLSADGDFAGGEGFYWATSPSSLLQEGFDLAWGWANPIPAQVSEFLSGAALKLVRAGRLVVLPAALVGCTQMPVGWTDDLLVRGLLNGVVNVGRMEGERHAESAAEQTVVDLSVVNFPFIDGISMQDLADVLDEIADWTGPLRRSFLRQISGDDLKQGNWDDLKRGKWAVPIVESEIQDACRYLQDRLKSMTQEDKEGNWRVAQAKGTMSAASRPLSSPGQEPVTDMLRSIAPLTADVEKWVPYWLLERRGGRLGWTAPLVNSAKPDPEMDPSQLEDRHSWLCPGTGGRLRLRLASFVPVEDVRRMTVEDL
jgi:hypothetical protein